jgi:hypothetical protein
MRKDSFALSSSAPSPIVKKKKKENPKAWMELSSILSAQRRPTPSDMYFIIWYFEYER